ncbi:MAG: hypothetical protein HKN25_10605 [Pyrinomonadaceae bacterium]|nr:hypothetical protein [Pyrinomonadaceae bacterium]
MAQGVKSIHFWSYGPTYASTENYWSDLKSEYAGIAKLNRSLEETEEVLYPAKTAADPVAVLYSVSHDIWNNRKQAVFTERRLLWHGLRHLNIQPDFLREEDVEAGSLEKYKALYITDWNISRRASAAIDAWIKKGGVVYLSAGAATRDEYNEIYLPGYSRKVWDPDAAGELNHQDSTYNERTTLQRISPKTNARVRIGTLDFEIPVIGVRASLNNQFESFATFKDGTSAGKVVPYGLGRIVAVGFMPMLAYGKLANFEPKTLSEVWQSEPREILKQPVSIANITPLASSDVPVVETNLLTGPKGDAIVLINYTYKPIESLTISIKTNRRVSEAVSVEGSRIKILGQSDGTLRLKLPLEWTDIITLKFNDSGRANRVDE